MKRRLGSCLYWLSLAGLAAVLAFIVTDMICPGFWLP